MIRYSTSPPAFLCWQLRRHGRLFCSHAASLSDRSEKKKTRFRKLICLKSSPGKRGKWPFSFSLLETSPCTLRSPIRHQNAVKQNARSCREENLKPKSRKSIQPAISIHVALSGGHELRQAKEMGSHKWVEVSWVEVSEGFV